MDTINFNTDIASLGHYSTCTTTIHNVQLNLELTSYSKEAIGVITRWKKCFEMLGKLDLIKNKYFMKIVYTLMSDSHIVTKINQTANKLDLWDPINKKFYRLETVNELNRYIKIRLFRICDTTIVIDCQNMSKCEIYEIYNMETILNHYQTRKVNWDLIKSDLDLEPKLVFDLDGLEAVYKFFAIGNIDHHIQLSIQQMYRLMNRSKKLEKKISKHQNQIIQLYNQ